MKFKIDENLHSEAADLLRQRGHDARTVHEQGLRGSADAAVAGVCKQEARALVTLDIDFSDIRAYPPGDFQGIVVLRLNDQSRPAILQVLGRILPLFDSEPLVGHLWIVDERQIRIRAAGQQGSP